MAFVKQAGVAGKGGLWRLQDGVCIGVFGTRTACLSSAMVLPSSYKEHVLCMG